MTAYDDADRRAKRLGWTRASTRDFSACPRRLVGKRCRNGYDYGTCWCCSELNDHGDLWRDKHGTRFVLWEPYGADDELAELVSVARQDGLEVRVVSSVWNPPHTIGIAFFSTTTKGTA